MRLEFKPQAFEDLQYWVQHQSKTVKRVMRILEESMRDPFRGIGKQG
jgi:toxin YoeB